MWSKLTVLVFFSRFWAQGLIFSSQATHGLVCFVSKMWFSTFSKFGRFVSLSQLVSVPMVASSPLASSPAPVHVKISLNARKADEQSRNGTMELGPRPIPSNVGKYQNGTSYTCVSARHNWDARAPLWVSFSKGFWAKNVLSPSGFSSFCGSWEQYLQLSMASVSLPFS